jgi:hypothetical protein
MTNLKRIINCMTAFAAGVLVWLGILAAQERSHDLPEERMASMEMRLQRLEMRLEMGRDL